MKQNRTFLNWLLLLMMTVGMTSCQGLVDAVFGTEDHPVQSGSTTPDIQIDNATLTLSVGQTASRPATAKSADIQLTYASSTPAVATVSQTGKVTAFSAGETTVTVSAPQISKSVSFKVVVNAIPAEQLAAVEKATPLTFLPLDDGKITVTFYNGITLAGDIHYTINDGQEQTIAKNTAGAYDIEVKKGDVVQLYSLNSALGGGSSSAARALTRAVDEGAKYINIRPSMKTEIFGNVMSLLKGKDNLEGADAIEANNAFYGLFAGAENLVNNDERLLVLPATTLTEGCYQDMFNGCKGIEKAPELPAPKLEKDCYSEMFFGCENLKKISIGATATADGTKLSDCTGGMLTGAGTNAEGGTQLILPQSVASGEAGFSVEDLLSASGSGENIKPYYANENGEIQDAILTVKVTGVTINLNSIIFNIDASITLTATVTPENAADKSVTWSSSNESVATVEQNGKISAVGVGEATITVTTTDGGKTATCKVIVNKKAGAISYATASVNKTFGDANFTNELTKTGDGTVTYSSDKESVAKVNTTTGEVTIKGNGEATITATVADSPTYTYATKTASYTIGVGTAAMTVSATGYSGTYDNSAHGITVNAPEGATIKYGTAEGTYTLEASPTYTTSGEYTVYYQVAKPGYTTVTGSATVTISKAAGSISYATASIEKLTTDAAFTNALTKTGDGKVTYSSDKESVAKVNTTTGEVTIMGKGEATITATVEDGDNYTYATKTASYKINVTAVKVPDPTINPSDNYENDGDPLASK